MEERERSLAGHAIKSAASRGRKFPEKADDKRLCFQKDKDRIIHSKAFRRLDKKTQVFMAGSGDHYRTRLTHTLEVAQISRDIARRLNLNEDLCEAIALAHDLGHPPFGHAGEEALNEIMEAYGSNFEHNEQSRRIVETLEKNYPDFEGLNLSFEVLDGLIKHQTAFDQHGKKFEKAAHLEAQAVNLADEIAYTNHDIDDGLRSGLITIDDLGHLKLWRTAEKRIQKNYGNSLKKDILISRVISEIMSMMVEDLCMEARRNIQKNHIKTSTDAQNFKGTIVKFSGPMQKIIKRMRAFLYNDFYMNPKIVKVTDRGKKMIKKVFAHYLKNPEKFPHGKPDPIKIKDYIAGMTDSFLIKEYNKL